MRCGSHKCLHEDEFNGRDKRYKTNKGDQYPDGALIITFMEF